MFDQRIQEEIALSAKRPVFAVRRPEPIEVFAAALGSATLALAVALAVFGYGTGVNWAVVGGLAVVAWLAERQSVQLTTNLAMSVSVLPVVFTAVIYGPLAAMAVGGSALLAEFGRPYERWLVWTATRALAGAFAGLVAWFLVTPDSSFAVLLVAVAAASVVETMVDIAVASMTLAIRRSGSIRSTLQALGRLVTGTIPLYTPVIAFLAYAFQQISPWTALMFFVPAMAAQRLFVLYQEQRQLADELATANTRLERANVSFAAALVATLDARDQYTAGHSAAVAIYSRDIAARMGLSVRTQRLAHLCGLVHDIGKVGLPAGLLEKAGPLSLEERRLMERHSEIGERILKNVDDYAEIAAIVRHHHERVDGRGYPDNLSGDEIPLLSRIISVADAYNAMTSDRPYRDAMPSRVARLRLAQAVESQFDTSVVAAFEAILAAAKDSYRDGTADEFTFAAQTAQSDSTGTSVDVAA